MTDEASDKGGVVELVDILVIGERLPNETTGSEAGATIGEAKVVAAKSSFSDPKVTFVHSTLESRQKMRGH